MSVRLENGLSQPKMADKLGVSMRAYHSYEKGERGLPIEAINELHANFGKSADWLLFGVDVDGSSGVSSSEYEDLANHLDKYIELENISISKPNLHKVKSMWISSCKKGEPAPFEIIMAWVDALKD